MVHIIENYYFTADENEYILCAKETKNKVDFKTKKVLDETKEVTKQIGYYSTLESLLNGCFNLLVREKVRNEKITTIQELVTTIEDIKETVSKLLSLNTQN